MNPFGKWRSAEAEARWRPSAGARPLVYGHRGARHAAPENTLEAFALAREEGADGVELDVRLTADCEVVVIHDATLTRVTSGRDERRVDALGVAELQRVELDGEARVPTLRQVLELCRDRGLRANVELKSDLRGDGLAQRQHVTLVKRAAAVLCAMPEVLPLVICSSFHPALALGLKWRCASAGASLPAAWLVHQGQRRSLRLMLRPSVLRRAGFEAVHPEAALIDAERLAKWRAAQVVVNAWTVNDEAEARRLAALGVDGLISDRPGALIRALE
ncbi:MAG: glycerophosphodiester phosphodiesterase [Polyangiaceae bacterium]|nr:glycerophosphodiester phosphodiesterase [Polyangiaceae bacterium]MCW5791813.1 glycerophosphodiester phosphodiesterase [Polyangiaceae bacterium]